MIVGLFQNSIKRGTELGIEKTGIYLNETIWLYISILEFLIIIFLIIKIYKAKSNSGQNNFETDVLKNAKNAKVDMTDLMDSINGSRELYKELSRKCHPDKFVNTEKEKIAEELFQEIVKYKRNYKMLEYLKDRAVNELNINF